MRMPPALMVSPPAMLQGRSVRTPFDVPRVGLSVFTIEDHFVGRIVQVAGGCFAVQGTKPIWLARDAIFTVAEQRLTLVCAASGLSRYIVERP
jgi:hypothetical protein